MTCRCLRGWIVALGFVVCWAPNAFAHKASDAYLQLTRRDAGLALRVDVALRDLDSVLDLDADADGRLTWAEVKAAWPAITSYVRPRVKVEHCPLQVAAIGLERRGDGAYAALHFESDCALQEAPSVHYTLFAQTDPTHRGVLKVDWSGVERVDLLDPGHPGVLASAASRAEKTPAALEAQDAAPAASRTVAAPTSFISAGLHHIVTGYDHLLFLLCLLLPAVMQRTSHGWQPVASWSQAVWPVLGIVTTFTVAHSVTLALAALGLVIVPSSVIEPAIALTIALAALDNVRPVFPVRRALVSFAFGLIHGFGFAGVLGELSLPVPQFAWSLFQFNMGLELGQAAIVTCATLLLFALRRSRHYPTWVIRGASFGAMGVGAAWFIERVGDVALLAH